MSLSPRKQAYRACEKQPDSILASYIQQVQAIYQLPDSVRKRLNTLVKPLLP